MWWRPSCAWGKESYRDGSSRAVTAVTSTATRCVVATRKSAGNLVLDVDVGIALRSARHDRMPMSGPIAVCERPVWMWVADIRRHVVKGGSGVACCQSQPYEVQSAYADCMRQ